MTWGEYGEGLEARISDLHGRKAVIQIVDNASGEVLAEVGSADWADRTIAGAVAIAKPPSPAVSVIAESPMSGLASSGP